MPVLCKTFLRRNCPDIPMSRQSWEFQWRQNLSRCRWFCQMIDIISSVYEHHAGRWVTSLLDDLQGFFQGPAFILFFYWAFQFALTWFEMKHKLFCFSVCFEPLYESELHGLNSRRNLKKVLNWLAHFLCTPMEGWAQILLYAFYLLPHSLCYKRHSQSLFVRKVFFLVLTVSS